ncbi:hypothetical protein SDC9_84124 [bioreactor metagenome]|uniref:Uncharacterized protein n=1 Tax=bioreactor metagenome TaxID=1076179 RepID=A0A644Z9E7_9ZZZZ
MTGQNGQKPGKGIVGIVDAKRQGYAVDRYDNACENGIEGVGEFDIRACGIAVVVDDEGEGCSLVVNDGVGGDTLADGEQRDILGEDFFFSHNSGQ